MLLALCAGFYVLIILWTTDGKGGALLRCWSDSQASLGLGRECLFWLEKARWAPGCFQLACVPLFGICPANDETMR